MCFARRKRIRRITMPRCKICKTKYTPKLRTTEPCPNLECRQVLFNRAIEKVRKQKHKELKEKVKTVSQYEAEAKRVFQKFIRLRDAGLPCISCGSNSPLVDGGHYKKAEIYSGVIFHELNCNGQCQKCNRFLGGNELNYRVGLIAKIGLDRVEELERLADETRRTKLSKQELVGVKLFFAEKIRNLNNQRLTK